MRPGPPSDVAPERLFRLLIRRPRPRLLLPWRAAAAPDVALYAVALRGVEQEEDAETIRLDVPPPVRERALWAALAVRALHTEDGPALRHPDELDALADHEAAALYGHLFRALTTISPTYTWSDWEAWERVLRVGANHLSNMSEALAMGHCADHGSFGGTWPRPDRYYGLPVADLTDGHRMAFRAACAVTQDIQKRNG